MGLHFIKERAHFIYLLFFGFFKNFIYLFYSFIPFFYLLNDLSTPCMFNVEIKSSVIS